MAVPAKTYSLVAALLLATTTAFAGPIRGFWLSPDWIVTPSDEPLKASEARASVAAVLDRLAALGVNTLFMETYLRGYGLAPMSDRSGRSLPVYPLTRLASGEDFMNIVIDEGAKRGMSVHAWVHVLFWKTDNPSRVRRHHVGRTLWDDLVVAYLRDGAKRASGPAAGLVSQCADLIARQGMDDLALADMLRQGGATPQEDGVLGSLVKILRKAGVPPPSFLVRTPSGDPHVPGSKDPWMTLYLNPLDPQVVGRTLWVVQRVVETYPRLAGVHLDHIRYPKGPHNMPAELADLRPGASLGGAAGRKWERCLAEREGHVASLVEKIKALLPEGMKLSSAVHPLYYFDKEEWASTLSGDDFVSQGWYTWGVDFVVPMIYDSDASRIGRIVKRHRFGMKEAAGDAAHTQIVPGTNLMRLIGPKSPLASWVYFDFDGLRAIKEGRTVDRPAPAQAPAKKGQRQRREAVPAELRDADDDRVEAPATVEPDAGDDEPAQAPASELAELPPGGSDQLPPAVTAPSDTMN